MSRYDLCHVQGGHRQAQDDVPAVDTEGVRANLRLDLQALGEDGNPGTALVPVCLSGGCWRQQGLLEAAQAEG